jgi:predicted MFS family arabinose efflux permease
MNALLTLLRKSLIDPLMSMERSMLYICAFMGSFGFYGLLIYLAFDYTGSDLTPVISFFIAKFGFSNIFVAPFILMLIRRYMNAGVFIALTAMQWVGLLLLFFFSSTSGDPVLTFMVGIIISFITEPFYAIYHMMMIRLTTDENRGHDVSMAELSLKVGVVAGSMAVGFMLTFLPGLIFLIFAGFCLILPAVILAAMFVQSQDMDSKLSYMAQAGIDMKPSGMILLADRKASFLAPYKMIAQNISLSILTMLQGGMNALVSFYAPIWLKILGFSALMTGFLMGMQVVARFFVEPISGLLYEKGKGHELMLAGLIFVIGWLVWLFMPYPVAFTTSVILWAVYTHMINVGIDSRWYAGKTLEGMACREVCFGVGRLVLLLILIPLLYISPLAFFIGCISVGLLFLVLSVMIES